MAQTRLGSLTESLANIAVGMAVNMVANWVILPAFGMTTLTWRTNLTLGVLYTGVSLARSYVLRRWFNGLRWGNK